MESQLDYECEGVRRVGRQAGHIVKHAVTNDRPR